MVRRLLHRWVLRRRWLTFVVLCLSFALFGAGTLNLFNMFRANLGLIFEHGTMALADGAAQQLLELVASLLTSMLAYIVFKVCEYSLVHDLAQPPEKEPHP
jgi:hypothetical protein